MGARDLDQMMLDDLLRVARAEGLVREYEFGDETVRLQVEGRSKTLRHRHAAAFLRDLLRAEMGGLRRGGGMA